MGVAAYTDPLSTMNTYPDYGFVEICMSSDCNVQNPSLVLSLDHLGNDVSVDPSTKQVTFGTELSVFDYTYQFAKNIDEVFEPFLTTPAVDDSASPTAIKSTMTLKMCATGCTPRTAESGEMQATASGILKDSIVLELEVLHRVADVNVNPRGFEQYTFPRNGLQVNLNMAISPPASDPSFSLSGFALTFLLAVTDSKAPLTQTSMSQPQGTMYLHRLEFGSDMFMDLPTYGTMDGSAHPITVSAIPLTSVDTANMIQVTLEFGSATSVTAIKYVSCVTPGPSAFAHTLAPTVVTPLKAASGVSVPQNLVFLPRVSFALCLDPICSTSALAIGFRGVGNTDWINLKRFRDSTAFQFADPLQQSLSQYGQAEVYWSSFSAWVPKYKQSLPVKVDPALASAHLNDPRLDVEVAYFLTNGSVSAGSASIAIPVNSVKLTIMISNWYFVSSTDSLKFNLTLSSLTDSLKSVVDFSTSFSSIVKTATTPLEGVFKALK
ncbi:hypothetical protein Poli38472_010880 [Pythium oligandrum]|uniref:Uncharacterized protein n=1 Tax=Pythium oligandrum TaxID=41045 RepID=A0A8K1FJH7_PYTOL|nr:hypothetical protein Poli38472_010880 [Pythium oligandrum]|eukprot:TMW61817.1 hypothetical protein Poli38472_010880 [Pythium oligandrum]